MEEKTNLEETNPSESDVSSEGSSGEVQTSNEGQDKPLPDDYAKQKIEETLGRKFDTLEEALRTVKSTYAESSRLAQEIAKKEQQKTQATPQSPQFEKLADELDELKFNQTYPNAKDYYEKAHKIAKAEGISSIKAFESVYKEVFENKKAQEAQKEEELKKIPQGSQKIGYSSDEFQQAKDALRRGDRKPISKILAKKLFGEE